MFYLLILPAYNKPVHTTSFARRTLLSLGIQFPERNSGIHVYCERSIEIYKVEKNHNFLVRNNSHVILSVARLILNYVTYTYDVNTYVTMHKCSRHVRVIYSAKKLPKYNGSYEKVHA